MTRTTRRVTGLDQELQRPAGQLGRGLALRLVRLQNLHSGQRHVRSLPFEAMSDEYRAQVNAEIERLQGKRDYLVIYREQYEIDLVESSEGPDSDTPRAEGERAAQKAMIARVDGILLSIDSEIAACERALV